MPVSINGNTGVVTGLAALPDSAMASGSIIQVVQAGRNDVASQSTASEALWTGHNIQVTITPSNSSNKILIIANTHFTSSNDVNNIPVILQKQTGSGSFASITAANGAIEAVEKVL